VNIDLVVICRGDLPITSCSCVKPPKYTYYVTITKDKTAIPKFPKMIQSMGELRILVMTVPTDISVIHELGMSILQLNPETLLS
jgi:hypothetical protein